MPKILSQLFLSLLRLVVSLRFVILGILKYPSTKNVLFNAAKCDQKYQYLTLSQLTYLLSHDISEFSKNVISTLQDGDSRPFVVSFGVKRFSLETISGTWEWKLPFSLLWRQPTI